MTRVIASSQHRKSWDIWVSHPAFNPEEPQQVDMYRGQCIWTTKLHQRGAPPQSLTCSAKGPTMASHHWLLALVSCSWTWDAAPALNSVPLLSSCAIGPTVLICAFYIQMPTQFSFLNLRHVSPSSSEPSLGFWRTSLSRLHRYWFSAMSQPYVPLRMRV